MQVSDSNTDDFSVSFTELKWVNKNRCSEKKPYFSFTAWYVLYFLTLFSSHVHANAGLDTQIHPEGSWASLEVWSGCLYLRIQLGCFRRTINRATPPTERARGDPRDRESTRGPKKDTSAILSLCGETQGPTLPSALHLTCLGYCFYQSFFCTVLNCCVKHGIK